MQLVTGQQYRPADCEEKTRVAQSEYPLQNQELANDVFFEICHSWFAASKHVIEFIHYWANGHGADGSVGRK